MITSLIFSKGSPVNLIESLIETFMGRMDEAEIVPLVDKDDLTQRILKQDIEFDEIIKRHTRKKEPKPIGNEAP